MQFGDKKQSGQKWGIMGRETCQIHAKIDKGGDYRDYGYGTAVRGVEQRIFMNESIKGTSTLDVMLIFDS